MSDPVTHAIYSAVKPQECDGSKALAAFELFNERGACQAWERAYGHLQAAVTRGTAGPELLYVYDGTFCMQELASLGTRPDPDARKVIEAADTLRRLARRIDLLLSSDADAGR